jgi:hypothetical protein
VNRCIRFFLALLVCGGALKLSAQGTAFNYQGQLNAAGAPATGSYDLRFALYDAVTNGNRATVWLTNSAVPVTNGLFTTTLNFGDIFAGTNYWLDIAVRSATETNFTTLLPRQPILPVPYAMFATTASNVSGTVPATQLTGTLPSAQISGTYFGSVNFNNVGNNFSGTFTGGGAALTGLNASELTSGTVADARLTPNVALLNGTQTFTSINTFTNRGNSFIGSFFGNGLVGWIPVSGTSTQAMPDAGYLLLNSGLTTLTLPAASSLLVGDIVRISGAGSGGWQVVGNSNQTFIGNFASYRRCFLQPAVVGSDWRCLASSADGTRMYAGGNFSGGIQSSYDFGRTWNSTGIGNGSSWLSIACSADGNIIFAASNGGTIQESQNDGLTWTALSGNANWTVIACSADGAKAIAGASSGALVLPTGSSPANGNWAALACSSDATNIAAAIGSKVYTSTNGGASWINHSLSGNCSALVAARTGSKLVAAYNGGISTSTNFGASWTPTPAGALAWSSLAGSSDCTRLVAGVNGGLFYASANFGATWTALSTTNQYWSGLTMSADGSTFAGAVKTVGTPQGGIYYSSTSAQPNTTSTNSIVGSQGSAVELQYIGNGQFMPVSSSGILWAN